MQEVDLSRLQRRVELQLAIYRLEIHQDNRPMHAEPVRAWSRATLEEWGIIVTARKRLYQDNLPGPLPCRKNASLAELKHKQESRNISWRRFLFRTGISTLPLPVLLLSFLRHALSDLRRHFCHPGLL